MAALVCHVVTIPPSIFSPLLLPAGRLSAAVPLMGALSHGPGWESRHSPARATWVLTPLQWPRADLLAGAPTAGMEGNAQGPLAFPGQGLCFNQDPRGPTSCCLNGKPDSIPQRTQACGPFRLTWWSVGSLRLLSSGPSASSLGAPSLPPGNLTVWDQISGAGPSALENCPPSVPSVLCVRDSPFPVDSLRSAEWGLHLGSAALWDGAG